MQAIKFHSDYARMVVQGRGIDRHLLGLKLVAAESGEQVPEILSDPAWTRSTRHRISSSQVSERVSPRAISRTVLPNDLFVFR